MNRKSIVMDYANTVEISGNVKTTTKGMLEITDINRIYRQHSRPNVEAMGRGMALQDTGTDVSLVEASQLGAPLIKRQGLKVACPVEIAWRSGWLTDAQLETLAHQLGKSGYGEYFKSQFAETVITRSKR